MSAREVGATCCVVDVTNDNFKIVWPTLVHAISQATFVSIDSEMSGIGKASDRLAKDMQSRYTSIRAVARSRALLSVGLSCFKSNVPSGYNVSVFNISLMSSANYIIEPRSARFLAEHSFDFNKQIGRGVRYSPGGGEEYSADDADLSPVPGASARAIFQLLTGARLVTVHNGFIDLVFMYQAFFAELPELLSTFVTDLTELFRGGILDTKYVADFHMREPASFLEYLFRKYQRDFEFKTGRLGNLKFPIRVSFNNVIVEKVECGPRQSGVTPAKPCARYAAHGTCPKGPVCSESHDLDDILDEEERKKAKKRRRYNQDGDDTNNVVDAVVVSDGKDRPGLLRTVRSKGHRAGFDAFMTGYVLAAFRVHFQPEDMESFRNKIYLGSMPRPLLLQKSTYANSSAACKAFMKLRDSRAPVREDRRTPSTI